MKCTNCDYEYKPPVDKEWRITCKCPSCGVIYSHLPLHERELRVMMDSYFTQSDETIKSNILSDMYIYMQKVARSIHYKYYSHVCYDPKLIELYTHYAASEVVSMFIRKDGFKVSKSFSSYIKDKLTEIIFDPDKTTGFVSSEKETDDDLSEDRREKFSSKDNSILLTKAEIDKIISRVDEVIIDPTISFRENLLFIKILTLLIDKISVNKDEVFKVFKVGSPEKYDKWEKRIKKAILDAY